MIERVYKQEEILEGLNMGLNMFPMSLFWNMCDHFISKGRWPWMMKLYVVVLHAVGFTFFILGFAALFSVDIDKKSGTAAIMNPLCALQTVFKCGSFSYSTTEYLKLLKFVKRDFLNCAPKKDDEGVREVVKRNVKLANNFVKYAVRWNFLTLFMLTVMPFLRSQYIREALHFGEGPIYPNKICENLYPFEWNWSPLYEIILAYEQIAVILAIVTTSVYQALLLFLVMALVTHLEVVGHVVENIKASDFTNGSKNKTDTEAKSKAYQQLIKCVKDHQLLVEAGDDLAERYNTFLTFHLSTAIAVVIIATFNFSVADNLPNKFEFMTMCVYGLLEVALYCYCGQLLENASENLYNKVYYSEWEEFDPEFRKSAMMVMVRSNKPLCLRAARLYRVNLETLGRIQQLVYSSLTVLAGAGT